LKDTAKILAIDPVTPDRDLIERTAQRLVDGQIGVYPTHCLYGLGAHAMDEAAVERIFQIKDRPLDKPLLVLIADTGQVDRLARAIPPLAARLMQVFWPGRITFLFEARRGLPFGLIGPQGKIGIRLAGHPVAAALCRTAGVPLTGTSANLSGRPGCRRISELDPSILGSANLVLDAGMLAGGRGSSVVDVTVFPPVMRREGRVGQSEFEAVLSGLLG
jgi:L-threonylcarbamoyladenylate synthase